METRCIQCGHELSVFVRTIQVVKLRKKQWEHRLYEHETLVKTRTFEKLCVNPECLRYWNPANLPPDWILVEKPKVEEKKSFDEATAEIEHETSNL